MQNAASAGVLPDPIRTDPLWRTLSPGAAGALEDAARRAELGAGELLFAPGRPAQAPYFLLQGTLEATDRASGAAVRTFAPGEALDEMQLLAGTGAPLVLIESDEGFTCERVPSAWEVVRARLTARAPVRFPSLVEVMMGATVLHATHRQRVSLLDADFAFRPPIERFGMMDFPRLEEIVETGYEHACQAIEGWRASGRLDALLGAPSLPHPHGP
jgi:CRP-like cAMP-binding protein